MKVIGKAQTSFTPEGGQTYEGLRLYCSYESDKIEGVGTDLIKFVSMSKFLNGVIPQIGDEIHVSYNKYGKIDYVEVII